MMLTIVLIRIDNSSLNMTITIEDETSSESGRSFFAAIRQLWVTDQVRDNGVGKSVGCDEELWGRVRVGMRNCGVE